MTDKFKPVQTEVKHSQSKSAWNVVGALPGDKYKIARVPYDIIEGRDILNAINKYEALQHALFISSCFNNNYTERKYKG